MTLRVIRRLGNRGFILISSYLLLSLFLVYSNSLMLSTVHQHVLSTSSWTGSTTSSRRSG